MDPVSWQETARQQQELRDKKIPEKWILQEPPLDDVVNVLHVPEESGIMTKKELTITEMDATSLLCDIKSQKLTSYQVTLAFCKRAAIAQQVVNCLTQIFFGEALQRAAELDQILQQTGKTMGRYHGLPFSIKDHIDMAGKESSAAFIAWVGHVAKEDAPIVEILRKEGAVFFVKTNNPQTLMHLETESNVFGLTRNPYNRKLTCGGSSGGEGALVGFCGSPIGLGGDGGGSIRSPAANQGLFGMKPTADRIPARGCKTPMPGYNASPVAFGPICRSARDVKYFFQTVVASQHLRELAVPPVPWRPIPELPKLRVGVFHNDGVVQPHSPILAEVEHVTRLLKAYPYIDVITYEPPPLHAKIYDLARQLYFPDGGEAINNVINLSGERVLELSAWVMKNSHTKNRSATESLALNAERVKYRDAYINYWRQQYPSVHVLLGPAAASVALPHGTSRYWGYTAVWNLVDFPACTLPTGMTCSSALHPKDPTYAPRNNEFDAYNWNNYNPAVSEGAPICLQVIGQPWDDELVIKAVECFSALLPQLPRPSMRPRRPQA